MVAIKSLIDFETKIGDIFNKGLIKAPIHLYSGNEELISEVFQYIDVTNDWVCCTWRNHYQGLLKGIPESVLEEQIMKGKSMVMNLPEYKFICSSIVGGIPSIAAGIVGDMSAETGHFHEAYKYSLNHKLPITFIVEDNKKSVCTPTPEIWGRETPYYLNTPYEGGIHRQENLIYYQYSNEKYPHAGAGLRVQF